jgi:hypothetical protein
MRRIEKTALISAVRELNSDQRSLKVMVYHISYIIYIYTQMHIYIHIDIYIYIYIHISIYI